MADQSHLDHPDQWTTGSEPSTTKQRAFLDTLGHDDPSSLNKSQASAEIDKLKSSSSGGGGTAASKQDPAISSDAHANGAGAGAVAGAATGQESKASEPITDPKNWATGDEPATNKQRGYIAVMAKDAGESVPAQLNKSEASEKIAELKDKTGK